MFSWWGGRSLAGRASPSVKRTTQIMMWMKFQLPIKEIDLGTASQDLLITAELAFYRFYLSENPDELVVGTRKHGFS